MWVWWDGGNSVCGERLVCVVHDGGEERDEEARAARGERERLLRRSLLMEMGYSGLR